MLLSYSQGARDFSLLQNILTSSGAHLAPSLKGITGKAAAAEVFDQPLISI